jgi:chromate transporter
MLIGRAGDRTFEMICHFTLSQLRFCRLKELARLFLRLGFTAFGGPAVHIAMMEDEVVRRRNWLTPSEFLDLVGAVNLIPGPNSTELAIHIGHRRHAWPGLIVAGVCFILPAMLIVMAIAWFYVRFGKLPVTQAIFYGIKPAIIAVIAQALYRLGGAALKTRTLAVICLASAGAVFAGANELLVLFLAGLFTMGSKNAPAAILPVPLLGVISSAPKAFGLTPLFLFFLKTGSVLFGSGYVLLAFLRADLVERWHWLTESQLLDAIAVGQVTPGPVFTTATFIGYILGGWSGALVATAGIFLPAFFFVAISGPLVPRIRKSRFAGAFLDGVNVASLALMAVVTVQLARSALVDWITIGLALVSTVLLLVWKLNSVWLVAGGAVVGLLKSLL